VASAKTISNRAPGSVQALDLEERAREVGRALLFPIASFRLSFGLLLLPFYSFTASLYPGYTSVLGVDVLSVNSAATKTKMAGKGPRRRTGHLPERVSHLSTVV
jgi:hypothetical protein